MIEGVTHHIDTDDQTPISLRPIGKAKASEEEVTKEIQELLKRGLIVPSNSPWASPMLIVKKKYGSNRFVIYYKKLDNITKKTPIHCCVKMMH